MTKDEALKLALDALKTLMIERGSIYDKAITAIREALAQPEQHQDWCASLTQMLMSMPPKPAPCNCKPKPEQEPVAIPDCGEAGHADGACGNRECLPSFNRNTTPPQRTWVNATTWRGLTDSEIGTIAYNVNPLDGIRQFSRAIEAKLKEKNT